MSTTAQQLPTGTWTLDPLHSTAQFAVSHLGASTFRARFEEIDAQFDGAAGTLKGSVAIASIDVKQPDFRGHLLSPDFFDAEAHPQVTFEATAITASGDGTFSVPGELTIRGTTKPIEARGTLGEPVPGMAGDLRLGATLEATVDRREFGLDWNAELPGGKLAAGWDVTLTVDLEFTQPQA